MTQANTADSASNAASFATWGKTMLPSEITNTILLLDSCFHSTHIHVITQAQRCDRNALADIDTLRTWVLHQQDVDVSYADKHKVMYFLRVVSELVSILYLKFDVVTVKQL